MTKGPLAESTSASSAQNREISGLWLLSSRTLPSEPELEFDGEERVPADAETRLAESYDRLAPAPAGALAGLLAGPVALLTLDETVLSWAGQECPSFVTAKALAAYVDPSLARHLVFAGAALAGALVGPAFALFTRHLRRFLGLLFASQVLCSVALIAFYAFVARRFAPALFERVPFVPALAAGSAFGAVLSLQLPVRRRRRRAL